MTSNKMFPPDVSNMEDFALTASTKGDSTLWHLRYGHLYMKGLKILKDKGMVLGLQEFIQIIYVKDAFMARRLGIYFPLEKLKELHIV